MKKLLIGFLLLGLIAVFFSCEPSKNSKLTTLPQYEVLVKLEHVSMIKDKETGFYFGSILIDKKVVEASKRDISEIAMQIALKENMGYLSIYTEKKCFEMNNSRLEYNEAILKSCYLGRVDITKLGTDWKTKITKSNFEYFK